MADDNTIKEYLVSLGFKIDEPGAKRFKDSMAGIEKTTIKFATAMAGLTTAVVTGVAEIAKQFSTLYYVSERTNATVESLNAVAFASSQIGLSAAAGTAAIEGLARSMRMNPGIAGYINSMGIKTAGRDTGDVLNDIVGKLLHTYGTGKGFAIGARIGQMLGIDPDTLLMMEKNYDKFMAKQEASRQAFKNAGVDQQAAAKASADFINELGTLDAMLEPLAVKFETRVLPVLTDIVKALEGGVKWMTKMDGETGGWSTGIFTVAGAFGAWKIAIFGVNAALRTLGLTAAVETGAGGGLWLLFKRLGILGLGVATADVLMSGNNPVSDADMQKAGFAGRSPGAPGSGAPTVNVGDDLGAGALSLSSMKRRLTGADPREAMDDIAYYMTQGYTRNQAIGIVANIQAESGGDPNAYNPKGGGRGAYGLPQWRGARITALQAYARSRGLDFRDRTVQRAFIAEELRGRNDDKRIQSESSVEGATRAMLLNYEVPSTATAAQETIHRIGIAQDLLGRSNRYNAATGGNVSVVNKTDIHVTGGDAHATAKAVAAEQTQVNANQTRNAAGLLNQ